MTMKPSWVSTAATVSAACLALACGSAQAGVEKMFEYRTKGGAGSYNATNYDGCTLTGLYVNAYEQENKEETIAIIDVYQSNYCDYSFTITPGPFRAVGVFTPPDNKLVSGELSGSVVFPLEHCDSSWVCTPGEGRLAVKWKGVGDTAQYHVNSQYRSGAANPAGGFVTMGHERYNAANREAEVEIQLEIDGAPIDLTGSYVWARLDYIKSGSFTMWRITP